MDMMVDIETLANTPTSVIVAIAGVKYDLEKRIITDEFYYNIDPVDSRSYGLSINQETIDWWMTQPKEVRLAWQKDGKPLKFVMEEFSKWVDPKGAFTCWGASFDPPIIESSLRAVGLPVPWKYWKVRCARTIGELYNTRPAQIPGQYHNALYDCKNQVQMLFDIFSPEE